MYIKKLYILSVCPILLSACSGRLNPAPIEFKGSTKEVIRYFEPKEEAEVHITEAVEQENSLIPPPEEEASKLDPNAEISNIESGNLDKELEDMLQPTKVTADLKQKENKPQNSDQTPQSQTKQTTDEPIINKTVINNSKSPGLLLPTNGKLLQNPTGKTKGIAVAAAFREPVKAPCDGKIVYTGYDQKFGNLILVQGAAPNISVALAHLDDFLVAKGATVQKGQVIGHVGQTGEVLQSQLYIAVKKGTEHVNPLDYFPYSK